MRARTERLIILAALLLSAGLGASSASTLDAGARASMRAAVDSRQLVLDELLRKNRADLDVLFPLLVEEEFVVANETVDLETEELDAIREAVLALGPDEVLPYLDSLHRRGPETRERLCALSLIGDLGRRDDLDRLVTWTLPEDGKRLRGQVRSAFQKALASLLAREPHIFLQLRHEWDEIPQVLESAFIRAVSASGRHEGVPLLAHVLTWSEGSTSLTLTELADLAENAMGPLTDSVYREVRDQMDSPDEDIRKAAILATGTLSDLESLQSLLELLESEHVAERESAAWALKKITGQALRGESALWRTWYEEEQAWFSEEAPGWYRDLGAFEDERVLEALRQLSRHCLERQQRVQAFAGLTRHSSVGVASSACRALERVGTREVLPALLEALYDHRAAVRQVAGDALNKITGFDHPPEAAAWADLVEALHG